MRTCLAPVVTSAALVFAGCGDDRDKASAERPSSTPAAERAGAPTGPCPAGTKAVTAAELVPRPARGYSLAPSDTAATKAIVAPLKAALRDRWRGHDEKVLARHEAASGTLLLVINSTERTSGVDAIVAGILDSGHDGEPISVRGQQTKLVRTAEDTYVTAGIAGECAVLLLFAATEGDVRAAVKQIR